MAAGPRTPPRTAPRSGPRRAAPIAEPGRLNRKAAIGGGALVAVAVFLYVIDFPALVVDGAEGLVRKMGLGLVVIAAWSVLAGRVISQQSYNTSRAFVRRTVGIWAAGLFIWGALGLNAQEWTFGSVHFKDESLGGNVGQSLVAGWMGKAAWLSLGLLSSYLLAPKYTVTAARHAPKPFVYAWVHRWPQRAAASFSRAIRAMVPSGLGKDADDTAEIGAATGGLAFRDQPAAVPAVEAPSKRPRPRAGPSSPNQASGGASRPEASQTSSPVTEPFPFAATPTPGSSWQYPGIDLLNVPMPSITRKHDNKARADLIVDTLTSFGVDASVVEVNEGPTVTQFGVEPGWEVRSRDLPIKDPTGKAILGPDGRPRTERIEVSRTRVRVNRITALQNDLALALAAPSLRIEAPVPGRAIVGIEVPNDSATVVTMRTVMETKEFAELARKSKLALALGKGVSGVPVVADLARMPHLLIAGATGSGKSVCMNAIIAGIMMNASPDEVRFVMIDPKRVELTPYAKIPHLAFSEVIVDMDKVVGTLQAVVSEMEARYKKFAALAVRNIEGYNKHPKILKKLPFWVVIIDELADLMMAAPFEVEKLICRLAQLARATGIHLVVATQRPSVDVITGLIKANFPTRIAFATTSMTDSRTILDTGGAEKLLGRGDMLYMPVEAAKPIRIQGVYLSDAEVERLVEFWTDERFTELVPENADDLLAQALVDQNGGDEDIGLSEEDDPLLFQARELALQHSRVSPSLFQRRLRIGFIKACKLVDALQDEGIVGPREDGESRRVLAGEHAESGLS